MCGVCVVWDVGSAEPRMEHKVGCCLRLCGVGVSDTLAGAGFQQPPQAPPTAWSHGPQQSTLPAQSYNPRPQPPRGYPGFS